VTATVLQPPRTTPISPADWSIHSSADPRVGKSLARNMRIRAKSSLTSVNRKRQRRTDCRCSIGDGADLAGLWDMPIGAAFPLVGGRGMLTSQKSSSPSKATGSKRSNNVSLGGTRIRGISYLEIIADGRHVCVSFGEDNSLARAVRGYLRKPTVLNVTSAPRMTIGCRGSRALALDE